MKISRIFLPPLILLLANISSADSINSPNIAFNVDANRASSTGPGAGNLFVTAGTVT